MQAHLRRYRSFVPSAWIQCGFAAALLFSASNELKAGACDPCDADCNAVVEYDDLAPFVDRLLGIGPCSPCAGDIDADGLATGRDIQPFVDCLMAAADFGACCESGADCHLSAEPDCTGVWFGPGSVCAPDPCVTATLTAHRPQHGAGYFPHPMTPVADLDEEDQALGPGIRINAPGDVDPAGEDDLIEVLVSVSPPGSEVALARSDGPIAVWTTRTKSPGTEIPFIGDRTEALPIGPGESDLTLWVEWQSTTHGLADLHVEPLDVAAPLDTLRFHTLRGIVMALGGEGQVPSVPVDPNHGTFVVATSLYGQGFDVHIHDEDGVAADGSGPVYNEVVNAIQSRLVEEVSVFGYSHGGGSTYDLADRLDVNRAGIGVFEIVFTSYVDSVENDSDIDTAMELRRPPSTFYHANHYQVGSLADFFLDGGPVPDSNPTPTGLNVETQMWGIGATHFLVDDYFLVRSYIEDNLILNAIP